MKFNFAKSSAPSVRAEEMEAVKDFSREVELEKAKQEASAQIRRAKIRFMERPSDERGEPLSPEIPTNISEISSGELGDLYAKFCIMVQYSIQQVALADIERMKWKNVDEFARSRSRLLQTGTVPDKQAKVETDSNVRTVSAKLFQAEANYMMFDAMLRSYTTGKEGCSREMTRRQNLPLEQGF